MIRLPRIVLVLLAAGLASGWPVAQAATNARGFASPDDAVTALMGAVKADDRKALLAILGPESRPLVYSGDAVGDRAARARFAAEYDAGHHMTGGGGKMVLYVGPDDFPFPIPLVPDGPVWRFDTRAGANEILNRRIGRNEISAIQACLAYVDAQRDYYSEDRNANGLREYAQRFVSSPGRRDGLFWPTKPGETSSPLGPLMAQARAEGYESTRTPYFGYFYRILTAQGADAPKGAFDYRAHGHMIGGFALVAFPAQYGVSGVMTFIVSHDGIVYQKNLGPDTAGIARKMTLFNPDPSWQKV